MSTPSITSSERAEREARRPGLAETNRARLAWLALACGVLMLALLASIAIGSRNIPLGTVLDALFAYDDSDEHAIIRALRLPRTVLGLGLGMALGLAGALIQAMTRNPLADPGILGVNAGAAFFVVLAIGFFGVSSLGSYVWFAFAGAFAPSQLPVGLVTVSLGGLYLVFLLLREARRS